MAGKLNNKQGATMMMALLFLLVAMMVSAVVISAALTATKVVDDERGQQQAYLNVSSAAKLLETELMASNAANDLGVNGMTLGVERFYTVEADGSMTPAAPTPVVVIKKMPGTALDWLWGKLVQESTTGGAKLVLPLNNTVTFDVEAPNMGKVHVTFTIWKDTENRYEAKFKLTNADEKYPCTLYMHTHMTAVTSDNGNYYDNNQRYRTVEYTSYTWGSVSVNAKEDGSV